MNTIKVKDFDSMQAITVNLARNGYMVTVDSVTDENYKEHWEIKYCEFSEIKEKPVNNDNNCDKDWGLSWDSMETYNEDNTKGVKCKILPDEKPLVENDNNDNDPAFKPVSFDEKEKPLVGDEEGHVQPYGLSPRDNTPDIKSIPQQDVSYNTKEVKRKLLPDVKID